LCSLSFCIHAEIIKTAIDSEFYEEILEILNGKYPEEPEKVKCMMRDFKSKKLEEKDNLQLEMQKYIERADLKCTVMLLLQSPMVICILLAIFVSFVIEKFT
jgi:hypothetical protein